MYYIVTTVYGAEVRSKGFGTYQAAFSAMQELVEVARRNNFELTYRVQFN